MKPSKPCHEHLSGRLKRKLKAQQENCGEINPVFNLAHLIQVKKTVSPVSTKVFVIMALKT